MVDWLIIENWEAAACRWRRHVTTACVWSRLTNRCLRFSLSYKRKRGWSFRRCRAFLTSCGCFSSLRAWSSGFYGSLLDSWGLMVMDTASSRRGRQSNSSGGLFGLRGSGIYHFLFMGWSLPSYCLSSRKGWTSFLLASVSWLFMSFPGQRSLVLLRLKLSW